MNEPLRPAGWLPIALRRTVFADGREEVFRSLYCPFRASSVPIDECRKCEWVDGVATDDAGRGALLCERGLEEAAVPGESDPAQRIEDGELSTWFDLRLPISAAMNRDVTCVRAGVSREHLETLLVERKFGALPVVDEAGRPIGIVTKTDLLSHPAPFPRACAGDLMAREVVALPEEATLSRAAAVMAFEKIQRIPVLDVNGAVVGILSASDILLAIGRRAGYKLPPAR